MKKKLLAGLAVGLFVMSMAGGVCATTITLSLVDSYQKTKPFGMAYDGENIWWGANDGVLHEMATNGVDTGNSLSTNRWSALAWNGSQLVQAKANTLYFFNTDGTASTTATISGVGSNGLIDGLDYDHGQVWYSPDVGNVYRGDSSIAGFAGTTVLSGGGGFSGVERVDIGAESFLFTVNDASSPRRLDVRELDGTLLGQATFSNQRYEDLAFDGRYLWAADFYGNKIDKFDVLSDGSSILDDNNPVPEPATMLLFGTGLAGLVGFSRKRSSKKN
ncbi:PEP-CTERM sorting domain-containing protein [Desulfobacterota bacterium M19]